MAQAAVATENNFRNGLVSEATGLNFPENACTETFDCIHELNGSTSRRLGFDFENNFGVKQIDTAEGVYSSFLWRDVAGDGDTYILVVQTGAKLIFYDASTTDPISANPFFSSLELTAYSPTGAPSPATEECQYSSGNGLLFVTHPFLEPFYVSFDSPSNTFTGTQINIKVRDIKGLEDTTDVSTRTQTSLSGTSTVHYYNLLNQGWFHPSAAVPPVVAVNLTAWDTSRTDLPSDADVMWAFKNASDVFDLSTIANVISGNTPAPKGHYILNPFNEDRQTQTFGIAGESRVISNVSTSYFRPTTNTFFAGRVFFGGVPYVGYTAKIYFSQIVEKTVQYGYCYQVNDPTAQDTFDLLPSDGGFIDIQGAGTILKMYPVSGGLAVFCTNGIWMITGSTGIGFTANDYSINKISSIRSLTHTSFIDLGGRIVWWNLEGIYILEPGAQGTADVKNITHEKLLSFFTSIPPSSKRNARGYFNTVSGVVQWLYKSVEAGTLEETYEFDRILNLNTFTGAFYPWRISESDAKIHDIVVIENLGGAVTQETVVDESGITVVDNGEEVVVFTINDGVVIPTFKYVTHYTDSGTQYLTISEERDLSYVDWASFEDTGIDYTSTFTTGYKVRGQAMRKFSACYLRVYSSNEESTQFYIKGLWDYATSGDTGRWSPRQLIVNSDTDYGTLSKRIKIRGHGLALQFKVESSAGEPFNIIGWAEYSIGTDKP